MIEYTLVILKPDCIQRGLVGEIIGRIEKKGLKIVALKLSNVTFEKAQSHYAEHAGKSFFDELLDYITSSPVVLMVLEGHDAVKLVRKLAGATKPTDAEPGTIRGDYVSQTGFNIIHTSDSSKSAEKEIENFFGKDDIIKYKRSTDDWI